MGKLLARVSLFVLVVGMPQAVLADRISVYYEAEAATVVNTPLGLNVPRLTVVTGTFTFDTSTPDALPDDPEDGDYYHDGGGGFTASFIGHTLTGSATPLIEIRSLSDIFRFIDGPGTFSDEGGVMSIDGTPDDKIELWFSAGTETDMVDDSLINPFPDYDFESFIGTPHTFSISDESGTMLLQMTRNAVTLSGLQCGDVDASGGVSAADALKLLRKAVGTALTLFCPVLDGQIACGDFNGNGSVNSADALVLLRKAVGGAVTLTCST